MKNFRYTYLQLFANKEHKEQPKQITYLILSSCQDNQCTDSAGELQYNRCLSSIV